MTNQALADLALAADQAARSARKRGDEEAARHHDNESAALAASLKD